MWSRVARLFDVEPNERLKLFFLTLTFFFVIASYTIIKELKDSIFSAIVGSSYIPWAKIPTMIILVPALLFYSFLVDRLRRYQLLYTYSIVYGVLGLVFAYLLGHPEIGLANTNTSPLRVFGWIFYFWVEGYSPFMVSVFWAFANSVTDPNEAKKNYGIMVSGSKLGGIVSAALSWIVLSQANPFSYFVASDIAKHQLLLVISSLIVLVIPFVIYALMKNVSGKYLHGYEAAYQVEKTRAKEGRSETGMFSGLYMFIKYPYLLGIFCMVFFYEVINTVLSYQRVEVAQLNAASLSDVSAYLFKIILCTHFVGFLISLVGTRALLNWLGERRCLILIPVTTGIMIFFYVFNYNASVLVPVFVLMRAINYGFSYPVRESLYIPTVKEIKFKSKSWIDAFGTKFAKSTGSTFNMLVAYLGPAMIMPANLCFFSVLIGVWVLASWMLGRRFEWAVEHNEVIGLEPE